MCFSSVFVMCLLKFICILSLIFLLFILKRELKKEASSSGYTITKCAYYLYVLCFSPNIHFNKLFFCLKFSALVLLTANGNLALLPTYIQSSPTYIQSSSIYQISHLLRNMGRTIIKASKLH